MDATQAEGCDSKVIDEVLGLPEQGLSSVSLMYVGNSDKEKHCAGPAPVNPEPRRLPYYRSLPRVWHQCAVRRLGPTLCRGRCTTGGRCVQNVPRRIALSTFL